jgi:hypothetical protein
VSDEKRLISRISKFRTAASTPTRNYVLFALHITLSDTTSGTPPADWQDLSARVWIQIYGYIPVLYFCPPKPYGRLFSKTVLLEPLNALTIPYAEIETFDFTILYPGAQEISWIEHSAIGYDSWGVTLAPMFIKVTGSLVEYSMKGCVSNASPL